MADSQGKNEQGSVSAEVMGQTKRLGELVEFSADSIVSKTLLDKAEGTITLFAFDVGQRLSEHQTPFDAVVQIVEGKAKLTIGGKAVEVGAGEIIVMPANVPHSVLAKEKFKMLLTMIRSR